MSAEFEIFTGVGLLLTVGSAWAHLAVKLDRIERRGLHSAVCLKRIRLRLSYVERWLPPRKEEPPT